MKAWPLPDYVVMGTVCGVIYALMLVALWCLLRRLQNLKVGDAAPLHQPRRKRYRRYYQAPAFSRQQQTYDARTMRASICR